MKHWTTEIDVKADALFRTLPAREIRRRQDLCAMQKRIAFERRDYDAMEDLTAMDNALFREMLRRCV